MLQKFRKTTITQCYNNLHEAPHDENKIDAGGINNEKEELLFENDSNNTTM